MRPRAKPAVRWDGAEDAEEACEPVGDVGSEIL